MAIRTKRIKGGNGINYTKELDGPSDWAAILNDTYFKDLSDGLIYWKDLSGTVIAIYEIAGTTGVTGDGDYGNIIFVSEVGPTGDTRNDVIGKIMNPVDLEWASSIAQSGDTIHVKAGTYNVTTTGDTGLSVNGVNHYFEDNAKVYKSSTGIMFGNAGWTTVPRFSTGGNVYGGGSFYGSGACLFIYYCADGSTIFSGYTGFYSTPAIFEFDICENTFGYGFGGNAGGGSSDAIINGKTRMKTTGTSPTIFMPNGVGYKMIVNCPLIESTNPSAWTIHYGQIAGGCGDLIINSDVIINSGGSPTSTLALLMGGARGRLKVKANYISSLQGGISVEILRNLDLDVNKIDYMWVGGDVIKMNGIVDSLNIAASSDVDVALCHKLNVVSVNLNSNMNIGMSNVLSVYGGDINDIYSAGIVNLKTVNMESTGGGEFPNVFVSYTATSKTYNITGLIGDPNENKVTLNNKWNNNDTFNLNGGKLIIDNNTTLFGNTINGNGGKLYINGRTSDTQINYTGGTVVVNGATMIVSDQNKQIITTPLSSNNIKVYTGGLNTNKFIPFGAEQEKLKVNVLTSSPTITINGETFAIVAGTISLAAANMVTAINGSGTLAVTATQDNPGSDNYFYIEADVAGTPMVVTYDANTSLNEIVRYNNNGLTDIIGGTVIEDVDID